MKKKILFLSVILIFCLLSLEGLLRLYLILAYDSPLVVYRKFGYDRQPLMGFELMANVHNQRFPSLGTTFSSNSKGLRGAPEYGPKKAGEIRIGVMGGSCVFGYGASSDATTLSAQLQNELNAIDGSKNFQVINGGTPSYVSYQVLARLHLRMLELKPDMMIFYMGWNDMYFGNAHLAGRNFFKMQDNVYDMNSWQNFIRLFNENNMPVFGTHAFATTLFCKRIILRLFPQRTIFDAVVQAPSDKGQDIPNSYMKSPEQISETLGMLADNLRSIAGICKAHGIKVCFSSLISETDLFAIDRRLLNETIRMVAAEQDCIFLDSDAYITEQNLKGVNNPVDKYHLTDKGNAELAKWWAPLLLKNLP